MTNYGSGTAVLSRNASEKIYQYGNGSSGQNSVQLQPYGGTVTVESDGTSWYGTVPVLTPGTLIASQQYAPGTRAVYSLTTSLAAVDTTNATLSFTVPASGNVLVNVQTMVYYDDASAITTAVQLGLFQHGGSSDQGGTGVGQIVIPSSGAVTYYSGTIGGSPAVINFDPITFTVD